MVSRYDTFAVPDDPFLSSLPLPVAPYREDSVKAWDKLQQKAQFVYNQYMNWQPFLSDASLCVACVSKMEVWGNLSEVVVGPSDSQQASLFSKFSIGALASVPFALMEASKSFRAALVAPEASQRLDAALNGIGALGWAGDSLATSGFGAQSLGWLQNVSTWTTPLAIVSTGLSAVTLVTESLSWKEGHDLLTEMNHPEGVEPQEEHYSAVALTNLLDKSDYILNKHFRVDPAKLREQITSIVTAVSSHPRENKTKATSVLNALKDRIKTKNFSNKLAILAAIVGLIGGAILLFTPLGTLGLALMTVGYIVSIIKFSYEYRASRRFTAALQQQFAERPRIAGGY